MINTFLLMTPPPSHEQHPSTAAGMGGSRSEKAELR
jgi:hypothetical protein